MKVIVLILLCLSAITVKAQKDKVYLQSGKLYKGEITGYENGILTLDQKRVKVIIPEAEIGSIHYRDSVVFRNFNYTKGLFGAVSLGFLSGRPSNYVSYGLSPFIEVGMEYRLKPVLNVGVFGSVNSYDRYTITPIMIQYKALLSARPNGLFLYGRVGKGFLLSGTFSENFGETRAGVLLAAGIGYQKKINSNFLSITAGWQMQKITEERDLFTIWSGVGGSQMETRRLINRFQMKLDFIF